MNNKMNKCKNCKKQIVFVNGEWKHRAPFPNCDNPQLKESINLLKNDKFTLQEKYNICLKLKEFERAKKFFKEIKEIEELEKIKEKINETK